MRAAPFAALVVVGLLAGCNRGDSRARQPAQTAAQILRAEEADVDAAMRHVLRASDLVQSYRIEDERLSVSVDGAAWKRLGTAGQDAFKREMWKAWAASYERRRGPTNERIFLSVYDLAGNDLGSYFTH